MDLEQWKKTYKVLDEYFRIFSRQYPIYDQGKNKKIRSDAEREMRAAMHGATYTIKHNPEISELLSLDTTVFGKIIAFDEFKDPRYFRQDMPDILNKIEGIIKIMEEDNKA